MSTNDVHDVYRKSIFIADELRAKIVDGVYAPGERLPSRDDLVAHYAVGKATVQRAFRQLQDDGFAVAKVGSGTIVSTTSPHLTRYALLFPQDLHATGHNQLWFAMAQEARALVDAGNLDLHFGFNGHQGMDRYQGLMEDVKHRRLAGLIFASPPFSLKGTPLLDEPGIARAALMVPSADFGYPTVSMQSDQFIATIAEQALRSDCRRIALLASDQQSPESVQTYRQALERLGVPVTPHWVHGISNIRPAWGAALTQLLMAGPADTRPDCLIVLDDNLLPPIGDMLQTMGLLPPRDLQLIAHCNFPWPTACAVPAVRVGYCITECLQALMRQINEQREGSVESTAIQLPAYHDADYPRPLKYPPPQSGPR